MTRAEALKNFDEVCASMRKAIEQSIEDDGFTGIRHEDDVTGEIDAIYMFAWGKSAEIVNRRWLLEPNKANQPAAASLQRPWPENTPV